MFYFANATAAAKNSMIIVFRYFHRISAKEMLALAPFVMIKLLITVAVAVVGFGLRD